MQPKMDSLMDYNTFKDLVKKSKKPEGYQMIRLHWVFVVEHNGQHKAGCVAGGHLAPPPIESVYSGVVSMRDLRIVIFLSKLNDLEVYRADLGNAYLKATTRRRSVSRQDQSLVVARARWWSYARQAMAEGICRCALEDGIQRHQGMWMHLNALSWWSLQIHQNLCRWPSCSLQEPQDHHPVPIKW